MFYAAKNNAVCGYDFRGVAFESKSDRDMFVRATDFEAVSAKEARNLAQFDRMRRFPTSIFNERGFLQGVALFNDRGFSHIA